MIFSCYLLSALMPVAFGNEYEIDDQIIHSPAAILIDASTGQILYEKNAHQQHFPASTTKILSAIVVLEHMNLEDVVTINDKSPYEGGSSIALETGEQLTVEQLLYALLIASANDAASALAYHYSDDPQDFVDIMNQTAKKLGATNTHCTNVHGLHDNEHVSTAYDLAILSKYAMTFPFFRTIVTTTRYEIPPTNIKKDTRYLNSFNAFFHGMEDSNKEIEIRGENVWTEYRYANGIKRGYTEQANYCLVSSATHEERTFISVVLDTKYEDEYRDCRLMLDYALFGTKPFDMYDLHEAVSSLQLNNEKKTMLHLLTSQAITLQIPVEAATEDIQTTIEHHQINRPIQQYDPIASLIITYQDQPLLHVPLVSDISVPTDHIVNEEIFRYKKPLRIPYIRLIISTLLFLFIWRFIYQIAYHFFGYRPKKRRPSRR